MEREFSGYLVMQGSFGDAVEASAGYCVFVASGGGGVLVENRGSLV